MKFILKKSLSEKFPLYKEGILIVKGIDNNFNSDHSYQYLCAKMDERRANKLLIFGRGMEPKVFAWERVFTELSLKFNQNDDTHASHISLYNRVCNPGNPQDLPNINPTVNIINALQLEQMLPIGAHNLAKIEGDITIGENSDGLSFQPRGGEEVEEEIVQREEIVHADEKAVLTRKWCWRQGNKDLVQNETTDVIFFINSLSPNSSKIVNRLGTVEEAFRDRNEEEQITSLEQIANKILVALSKYSSFKSANFAILSDKQLEVDTETETFRKLEADESLLISKASKADADEISTKIENKDTLLSLKTNQILRDREIIDRILNKAVEEILPSTDQLEKMLLSGRRIKVYQGFDPTAETLHIGHTVMMRKLEDFRKLGHEVFFLIGDFTARIGDPTDKSAARKTLTIHEVNENLKLYTEQAKAIIDLDNKENPVTVVFNNDWLGKMKFEDVLQLASQFTVQQMLKRSMFAQRLEEDRPIYVHEFMYPMMQGWDSVNMSVDVELGGNDQLFNMLAGRDLVMNTLGKQKFVIAGKLLTTADGKKMGKSEGNAIKLSDSATDIYGKVMSFPDQHIVPGFELLTSADLDEIRDIKSRLESGKENPIDLKKLLAKRLTKELKREEEASKAEKLFEEVFQNRSLKSEDLEIPVLKVSLIEILPPTNTTQIGTSGDGLDTEHNPGQVNVLHLLTKILNFVESNSEAKRLVRNGAVYINGDKVESIEHNISLKESPVVKVGKKVTKVVIE